MTSFAQKIAFYPPHPEEKLLETDFLRSLGATPYYFGLGFVQLKLNDVWRMHFWVPEWPTILGAESEFHNHRYEFCSKVLLGCLQHEIVCLTPDKLPPDKMMEVIQVSCKPNQSEDPVPLGLCGVSDIGCFEVRQGSTYTLNPSSFHRSFSSGPTVTLLRRGPIVQEEAQVLRQPNTVFQCPFSIEKTTQECWDKIDEILTKNL